MAATPGVRSAEVSWTRVTGADDYIVQWKLATEVNYDGTRQEEIDQSESGGLTSCLRQSPAPCTRIPELTAGTSYTVQVAPQNEGGGRGDFGESSAFIPTAGTNNQVVGVEVTSGSEELEVTWDEVPNASGYKVQWKSGSEDYDDLDDAVDDPDDRTSNVSGASYTILDLTGGTPYMVQVIATVAEADGNPSTEATGTTPAPGQVENVQVTLGPGDPRRIVGSGPGGHWWVHSAVEGGFAAVQHPVKNESGRYRNDCKVNRDGPAWSWPADACGSEVLGAGLRHTHNWEVMARPQRQSQGMPLPGKKVTVTVTRGPQQLEVEVGCGPGGHWIHGAVEVGEPGLRQLG